jgi:hypothetical protein
VKALIILIAVVVGLFLLRIIVPVAIKVFALLFVRTALRAGLKDIGQQAMDKQPDTIHLSPLAAPAWRNPAEVERMCGPLLARGFKDIGIFTIPEMPGLQLQFLTRLSDSVYAVVYDHPKAGVWLNLVSRFQDGGSVTFSTNKDRGVETRPGKLIVYAPGASPEVLLQRILAERSNKPLVNVAADGVLKMFEEAYAEDIAWRKKRGPSATEVAKVMASRT